MSDLKADEAIRELIEHLGLKRFEANRLKKALTAQEPERHEIKMEAKEESDHEKKSTGAQVCEEEAEGYAREPEPALDLNMLRDLQKLLLLA